MEDFLLFGNNCSQLKTFRQHLDKETDLSKYFLDVCFKSFAPISGIKRYELKNVNCPLISKVIAGSAEIFLKLHLASKRKIDLSVDPYLLKCFRNFSSILSDYMLNRKEEDLYIKLGPEIYKELNMITEMSLTEVFDRYRQNRIYLCLFLFQIINVYKYSDISIFETNWVSKRNFFENVRLVASNAVENLKKIIEDGENICFFPEFSVGSSFSDVADLLVEKKLVNFGGKGDINRFNRQSSILKFCCSVDPERVEECYMYDMFNGQILKLN